MNQVISKNSYDFSESIAELAKALNKVQSEHLFALTDKENPFFKSKYADLSSVWSVARDPLIKNGLSVVQTFDVGNNMMPIIVTTLLHTSGEWIRGSLEMPILKADPQAVGSSITYGRRYALSAMLGICPEDDDGDKGMVCLQCLVYVLKMMTVTRVWQETTRNRRNTPHRHKHTPTLPHRKLTQVR